MPGKDLSQEAKRQGQWIRAESGNRWLKGGAGPGAGPSPVRLAPAQGLSGRRGRARVVHGSWRAESRRVPAKGGGAASVKSGAPAGRGGDAGCCGAGGWAYGDVTGLPLASLPSSGRAGRWATRSRAAAEEAARPPHGESRGSGPGSRDPRGCLAPGRSAGGRRARCPWPSALWDHPRNPCPLSRVSCGAAGRPDAPAWWCCDGKGPRDAWAAACLHREIRARLRCPGISKPGCSHW